MKYDSKRRLMNAIEDEHQALVALVDAIPASRLCEKGVWGDGWTVNDLLAHLTEWEQMFLRWYREGQRGLRPVLPAPGFKWRETPALNREIWRKHRKKSSAQVRKAFDASYAEILLVVKAMSPRSLLTAGAHAWTGKSSLATYVGANTSSHYRTAAKFIRRWHRGSLR
jgi:hypothetical protein